MRRACGSRGRSQLHLSLSQTPPAGARVPGRHMGLSRWGVHDARSREVLQPLCDRSDASDAQAQLIMASARSPGLIVSCSVVGPFLAAPSAWRSWSFPQVLFSGISHRHSCAEMTRKVAVDSSIEDVNRRGGRLRRHTGEESGLTAWSRRRRFTIQKSFATDKLGIVVPHKDRVLTELIPCGAAAAPCVPGLQPGDKRSSSVIVLIAAIAETRPARRSRRRGTRSGIYKREPQRAVQ